MNSSTRALVFRISAVGFLFVDVIGISIYVADGYSVPLGVALLAAALVGFIWFVSAIVRQSRLRDAALPDDTDDRSGIGDAWREQE